MSYERHHADAPRQAGIAVLTVSDSKGPAEDQTGDAILEAIERGGHRPAGRDWSRDDIDEIRERASELLASPDADALVVTGGTGVSPRDVTVEALRPHFVKELPGFGERFRALSAETIQSGAILSRATAGLWRLGSHVKPVFLLPGATDACRLAVERIINAEVGHLVDVANGPRHRHG